MSAFDFSFRALDGTPLPLRNFAGRPLLVVNTASKCGFTPQYEGLEDIATRFRGRGLVVLGVPSNDFAGQEPGTPEDIAAFCASNYHIDFPLTEKVHVRGPEVDPLFRWLAAEGGFLSRPRWNFYKYLIGRDGGLKRWFTSLTRPDSAKFVRAIEALVGENG